MSETNPPQDYRKGFAIIDRVCYAAGKIVDNWADDLDIEEDERELADAIRALRVWMDE